MKNEQRDQAHDLYFQTELTQTEIAERLNVSRRSICSWVREGNWDSIKKSAKHIPSVLGQKCYYMIGHLADNILSEKRANEPITSKEADTLHKVMLTINKLKGRSTASESLEMFTSFLDILKDTDPALAGEIHPHIEQFLAQRASAGTTDFPLAELNDKGRIPVKSDHQQNVDEKEVELDRQNEIWYQQQYEHEKENTQLAELNDKERTSVKNASQQKIDEDEKEAELDRQNEIWYQQNYGPGKENTPYSAPPGSLPAEQSTRHREPRSAAA